MERERKETTSASLAGKSVLRVYFTCTCLYVVSHYDMFSLLWLMCWGHIRGRCCAVEEGALDSKSENLGLYITQLLLLSELCIS